ncbi:MAG: family 20 glycosylhydrolase [Planctomycetes bacterium]|nr:family 20 glycosylhydrolase [Planctomycetota bacterium]
MDFIGWSIDIAREQWPSEAWLSRVLADSRDAGYNAVGLYLEHRYAYPSAPWAAGEGCLPPEVVRRLVEKFKDTGPRIIPFINTLGHMEGFIRSEGGQWLGEGPAAGALSLQMCPSRSECVDFARGLVSDILDVFTDEWIHLGGDETKQLGQCPRCAARAETIGKAGIYAEYYAPLCRWVIERGRRPCLWGDMLLAHPEAMDAIPRETLIFDWQYESRPAESTRKFREHGFDVICCPAIQTYNSGWCFLDASQRNIDQHAEDAGVCDALGVLVTTWEFKCFSSYASVMPLIMAAARRLARGEEWDAAIEAVAGPAYARVADILGNRIPAASAFLAPDTWRHLRDRLVMRCDPFELWREWRQEACSDTGDTVLALCNEAAESIASDSELRFPIELHQVAVQWVRQIERAAGHYTERDFAAAARAVADGASVLERLRPELKRIAAGGGSAADVHRLTSLQAKVAAAAERIGMLAAPTGYIPSFETIVRDRHIQDDQAAW